MISLRFARIPKQKVCNTWDVKLSQTETLKLTVIYSVINLTDSWKQTTKHFPSQCKYKLQFKLNALTKTGRKESIDVMTDSTDISKIIMS